MATAGDKADAGHNHLRYMLSSWFDSSKDDTWTDSAPMMADQKKPETEEQICSFVLEVLFCAWKMHALDPAVREARNRTESHGMGLVRYGVTTGSARGEGASNSGRNNDGVVSREASVEGVRQAYQIGSRQCRYMRVQTTPPDDIHFGRRSRPMTTPSPTGGWVVHPPHVPSVRRHQRPSRHAHLHHKGSKKKRNTGRGGRGENTCWANRCSAAVGSIHPSGKCNYSAENIYPKAFLPGRYRKATPKSSPPRLLVSSPPRCQGKAKARQDMAGRDQDVTGIYRDMADRYQDIAKKQQDVAGREQDMAGTYQDMADRGVLSEAARGWGGGRYRPLSEWDCEEKRERQRKLSVDARDGVGPVSRRGRRDRPTNPPEVLRRVTTCLERYSHFESRQRRAMTLCRAAQLANTRARSRSDIVTATTTTAAKLTNPTMEPGEAVRCRSGRPTLERGVNGNKRLVRGLNGTIGRDVDSAERLCRGITQMGDGDGADVVYSVRTEMLGRGPSVGKDCGMEDTWT